MSIKLVESPLNLYKNNSYKWTLYDLKMLDSLTSNDNYFWETFPETKGKWKGMLCIKLQPFRLSVELWLHTDETIQAKYSLFILNGENEIMKENHGEIITSKENKSKDFECFSTLKIINDAFTRYRELVHIKVIIHERIFIVPKPIYETNISQEISRKKVEKKILHEINTNEILKNDLKMMFENKEFTDFVIKLSDSSEISVHKNILAARSPVFSAMLKNDSLENNQGYVNITDISKETMIILLNYIYTGDTTSDLSLEEAKNLLIAADKYEILNLKRICGKYLESYLEISNAIDILLLSELYNFPELKNCAFELIIDNKESFLDPVKFQILEKHFPNLMTELVMKVFVSKT